MSRPKPAARQVWRHKNYAQNGRVVHILSVSPKSCTANLCVNGVVQESITLTQTTLKENYWLVSHHWSGDSTALLDHETISQLRGY